MGLEEFADKLRVLEPMPNRYLVNMFVDELGGEITLNEIYDKIFREIDYIISLATGECNNDKKLIYRYCAGIVFAEIRTLNKKTNFDGLRNRFIEDYEQYRIDISKLLDNRDIDDLIKYLNIQGSFDDNMQDSIIEELSCYMEDLDVLSDDDITKIWDNYTQPISDIYNKLLLYDHNIENLINNVELKDFWINKIRKESELISDEEIYLSSEQLLVLKRHISKHPIKKGRGSTGGKKQAEIIASLHHAKIINLSSKAMSLTRVLEYLKPQISNLASYKVIAEHFKIGSKDDEVVKELEKAAF